MIDRNCFLGQDVEITASFTESGVLVEPKDIALYPNYAVKDPNNDIVAFGVGTFDGLDNLYHAEFTIPILAPVSTVDNKWSVEWEMLGTNNKNYRFIETFDVALANFESAAEYKEIQKLTLASSPLILSLPLQLQPSEISFTLNDLNETVLYSAPDALDPPVIEAPTLSGTYNNCFVYNITIPASIMTAEQEYLGVWTFEENGTRNFIIKIYAINLYIMSLLSDLRMLMDKTLKPLDLYIGYRDSDLYNYLVNGRNTLNYIAPFTTWTFTNIKTMPYLSTPLLVAAAYWGLTTQYLAEVDNTFDYAGQALTLSQDHASGISDAASKMKEYLDAFKEQKLSMIRSGQGFHLGISYPRVGQQYGNSGAGGLAISRAPWLGS
jgi:hypothetical protein